MILLIDDIRDRWLLIDDIRDKWFLNIFWIWGFLKFWDFVKNLLYWKSKVSLKNRVQEAWFLYIIIISNRLYWDDDCNRAKMIKR